MEPETLEPPDGFSWVDEPHLAGLARPGSVEDLLWLRRQGIEVLIALTEEPPRRHWVNDAGLMAIHVPVEDMTAPSQEQLDQCLNAIRNANQKGMGVAVHCGAGLGRTGVVLASYLVSQGLTAGKAIARVRKLRPGSIETPEQEEAIAEFERRQKIF